MRPEHLARAFLVASTLCAGAWLMHADSAPAHAGPPAMEGVSGPLICSLAAPTAVRCQYPDSGFAPGYSAVAVENDNATGAWFGYYGMTASNYSVGGGFKRCTTCSGGISYAVDIRQGQLYCMGGTTVDAGVVIAVQCVK